MDGGLRGVVTGSAVLNRASAERISAQARQAALAGGNSGGAIRELDSILPRVVVSAVNPGETLNRSWELEHEEAPGPWSNAAAGGCLQWRGARHSGAHSNGGPNPHAGADRDSPTCSHSGANGGGDSHPHAGANGGPGWEDRRYSRPSPDSHQGKDGTGRAGLDGLFP